MPSLRTILMRAGLAVSALLTAANMSLAATTVKLGVNPWIGYGPLYVAAAKGFFAAHGLDVQLVNFDDNAAVPGALYSGEVNVAALTYDQVIGTNAKGWHLEVVMPIDYSAGADAMLATDDITSVTQLKGLKVAYAPLSPSDFLLGYALAQYGMSEKDIVPVNTEAEGVPGIMAGGSTKVGVTYEPNVTAILQADGGGKFHVLFSSKQAKGMIIDVLTVTAKTAESDPQLITAMIEAFVQGEDYMKSNPADADAIIGKAFGISASEAAAQLAGVQNPPLSEMPAVLAKSPSLPSFYVSGPIIGGLLKEEGQISSIPPIAGTFDANYVDALANAAK
jgi:NitT/TauT family transport system substrate-binding protein